MIRWIALALFFGISLIGFSQRYSFLTYSTAEGLPQSQVTSITQDKQGYLWVGTLGGLAKFNGKTFTSYTTKDGLHNNKITFLNQSNNELLIGHEGGISIGRPGAFASYSLGEDEKTTQVGHIIRQEDKIYVATIGSGLFEVKDEQLVSMKNWPDSVDRIRDIAKYGESYYFATNYGVYKSSNLNQSIEVLPNFKNWNIDEIEIHEGKMYLSTFGNGWRIFDLNARQEHNNDLGRNKAVNLTYFDSRDNCWLLTDRGLFIQRQNELIQLSESNGLPLNDIRSIHEDDEGNIWLGSMGKGLIFFPGFQIVHFNKQVGMPSDLVLTVNKDKNQKLWIGSFDQGLIHKKNGEYDFDFTDLDPIWSSAMHVDGYHWFGTQKGLLCLNFRDNSHKTLTTEDGLLRDKITCLYRVNDRKMLIGGRGGLQDYKNGKISVLHDNDKQDIGTIRGLCYFNDSLFIASDKGLWKYHNNQPVLVDKHNLTTYSLANDLHGNLWLGTEEGLFRYSAGKITSVNHSPEPPSRFIVFLEYFNKRIYCGTNNGLFVFGIDEKGKIIQTSRLGRQEGIVNLETNLNSGFIDDNGYLWFGTASGMIRYEINNSQLNAKAPRIILQNALLNYVSLDLTEVEKTLENLRPTQNNLSFAFDGISLSYPEDVNYQYWLEGAEETWGPPVPNPSPSFPGLEAGEYVLHARAVGIDGILSNEVSIPFHIMPPVYKRPWFIILATTLIAAGIFLIFRFRLAVERDKNEIEKSRFKNRLMTLEQKSLNASMNRHFIFNSLNSIQYFINTQDKRSANKYLSNFAQLIRKNLDAAEYENNRVPLSQELERLKLYLELEQMRFQSCFDYQIDTNGLNTEAINIPTMLLQPYVENSIIHGILPMNNQEGMIEIIVRKETESLLRIDIIDNGIGYSNSIGKKIESAGDHRSQGMEINTKRIDLIKKLSKQYFSIDGPRDHSDENRSLNGTIVSLKLPYEYLDDED